jgi:hypothetical protein
MDTDRKTKCLMKLAISYSADKREQENFWPLKD